MICRKRMRRGLWVHMTIVLLSLVACVTTGDKNRYPANAPEEVRNYPPGGRFLIWNIANPVAIKALQEKAEAEPPDAGAKELLTKIKTIQATMVVAFEKIDKPTGITKFEDYTVPQARFRAMLIVSRQSGNDFFAELRKAEPVFCLPGDDKERATCIVARYDEVHRSFGEVSRLKPPPDLNVIYTPVMEPTLGGNEFMLSRDGREGHSLANEEKFPLMHDFVNNSNKGNGSKDASMKRVRHIVKRLTLEALRDHADDVTKTLDVGAYISRNISMGLVSDYFGFYPPDFYTQVQWSQNTQQSFFHNPLNFEPLNKLALAAGQEMQAYITKMLMPELKREMEFSRPAYDTVTQMIQGHAQFEKGGVDPMARVMANTIGLLVGAGETTNLAVTRSLYNLLTRPDILPQAIAAAKKANSRTATAVDNQLFDHYVWEALRFQPINPWVERRAFHDYSVTPVKEVVNGTDVPGTPVPIAEGTRVLVAMQSGMMDSKKYKDPTKFDITRPLGDYMHVSIDYHRCLGDDVALVMVPEIIKQVLINLPGLRLQMAPDKEGKMVAVPPNDPKGSPFPETWKLEFDSKSAEIKGPSSHMEEARAYLFGELASLADAAEQVSVIRNYVTHHDDFNRVRNPLARLDFPQTLANSAAIDELEKKMVAKVSRLGAPEFCVNATAVETFRSAKDLQAFCSLPFDFRACYFLQRTAALKSPQHAFDHCAFRAEAKDAAPGVFAKLKTLADSNPTFAFLKYYDFSATKRHRE